MCCIKKWKLHVKGFQITNLKHISIYFFKYKCYNSTKLYRQKRFIFIIY